MKKFLLAPVALLWSAACAQGWIIHAGITQLDLSSNLSLSVAGHPVPGAALRTDPQDTPSFGIGHSIARNFVLMATVGLPPHVNVYGGGTIAPFGKLESTTYGPTALTLQYHPLTSGFFRPYAGVGASYMIIFSTQDAAIHHAALTNDLAPAFEVGSDFMINRTYGLFVDFKKTFLHTRATGTLGYPVDGEAKLDPFVASLGLAIHL